MTAVTLDETGACTIERLPLMPPHDLRTITGTLEELVAGAEKDPARLDHVRAELTNRGELLEPMAALRAVYPNILELRRLYAARVPIEGEEPERIRPEEAQPEELFAQFYRQMTGEEWTAEEQKILQGVLERLLKERA